MSESNWMKVGLKGDPFSTSALLATPELPNLFAGRKDELTRIATRIATSNGSINIIAGEIGVGKSTLVNALGYFSMSNQTIPEVELDIPRLLPCYCEIVLTKHESAQSIMKTIISSLAESVMEYLNLEEIYTLESPLRELLALNIKQVDSDRIKRWEVGLELISVKVENEESLGADALYTRQYLDHVLDLIESELNFDGVILCIDRFKIYNDSMFIDALDVLRDIAFVNERINWFLFGDKGISKSIIDLIPRFRDFIEAEIVLNYFSLDDLHDLVKKRIDYYRIDSNIEFPVDYRVLRVVYRYSHGHTRNTVKLFGSILRIYVQNKSFRGKTIDRDLFITILTIHSNGYLNHPDLSDEQRNVMEVLLDRGSFRPLEYAEFGHVARENFTSVYRALEAKGLIYRASKETNKSVYKPDGLGISLGLSGRIGEAAKVAAAKLVEKMVDEDTEAGQLGLFSIS